MTSNLPAQQEQGVRINKEFYSQKDTVDYGLLHEKIAYDLYEARKSGDRNNFFAAVTAADHNLTGHRDQIYDEEMRLLDLERQTLHEENNLSDQEIMYLYYDKKNEIVNKLLYRVNRGKVKVRDYVAGGKFASNIALKLIDGIGQNIFTTGKQGSGKSWSNLALAAEIVRYTGKPFLPSVHVVFDVRQFMKLYNDENLTPPGSVIVCEEWGVNMNSRAAMSKDNNLYNQVAQTVRFRAVCVIMNAPDLSLLDATPRKMLHWWLETERVDKKLKQNVLIPHYVEVNQQTGVIYYPFPVFDLQQVVELRCDAPPKAITDEYERLSRDYKRKLALDVEGKMLADKKSPPGLDKLNPDDRALYDKYAAKRSEKTLPVRKVQEMFNINLNKRIMFDRIYNSAQTYATSAYSVTPAEDN